MEEGSGTRLGRICRVEEVTITARGLEKNSERIMASDVRCLSGHASSYLDMPKPAATPSGISYSSSLSSMAGTLMAIMLTLLDQVRPATLCLFVGTEKSNSEQEHVV